MRIMFMKRLLALAGLAALFVVLGQPRSAYACPA
jgi:hypothetical protein